MSEPLLRALVRVRGVILDDDALVRAVASGRQRGSQPPWRRVELRYVDLKAGRHLQVTAYDDAQAHTRNHPVGDQARAALDDLLDQPVGNWHVETTTETLQLRVTKKGDAVVHSRTRAEEADSHPVLPGSRARQSGGPDEAEPSGQVPPGRGVPAHPGRLDQRRPREGPSAPADARGAPAGRGPRLWQCLPDVRHRAFLHPRPWAAGPPDRDRPA